MKPTLRNYRDENDFWRIRQFLREVFVLNGRREHSWHAARWDYLYWHLYRNCGLCDPPEENVSIWETSEGQIAAVMHPIDPEEAFLHIHPAFRTPELEQEMILHAERSFANAHENGTRRIYVPVDEDDAFRKDILRGLGYAGIGEPGYEHTHDLGGTLPSAPTPAGYMIRSMGGEDEHPARSWASWQAFHPDEPDEDYEGWEWYAKIQSAPLYRRDLDVVAVTGEGQVASFCTSYYDDATRSAVTVLVATAAPHWRRGLGKAVLCEAMRRLERLGCTRVFAKATDAAAEAVRLCHGRKIYFRNLDQGLSIMKLNMRNYRDEDDYWRIRQFLREVMILNDLRELSWSVARLDYWRFFGMKDINPFDVLPNIVFLWETPNGEIAAVLNPEDQGDCFMQVHPAFKTKELEEEMISAAVEHLSVNRGGRHSLSLWADSQDAQRQELLARHGFSRQDYQENQWRRDLDGPIPDVAAAEGYTIRALGEESELPARSWASWRGFHPDEPDENYQGWEWYHDIQRCPLYRRDLDLVAATGDIIAAFATFWFDDVTRTVYIEPVATVPEHQRKGLARAVITEGLQRVQRLGAVRAFVGGYEAGPNALYSSVLSPACDQSAAWVKEWQDS